MKRRVTELLTTRLRRQALHAWRLQFIHPISAKELDIKAPLPEDLLYTLNWLDSNFAIDKPGLDLEAILNKESKW